MDEVVDLVVESHPSLAVSAFTTELPDRLAGVPTPATVLDLLRLEAKAPVRRSEDLRTEIRNVLRHGGFKPTGRGKPASEYLVRAAEAGLRSINAVVDVCNAVSLHSGFPISVVDLAKARPPFRIVTQPPDTRYVFNASGQEIDVSGLVCLEDEAGPCANAVKDSQRTKTDAETRRTLSVIWASRSFVEGLAETVSWYRQLLEAADATTQVVCLSTDQ